MTDQNRRTAIVMLAGAAVVGTAVALGGCAKNGHPEHTEEGEGNEVTANEDLMREHGVLRRILIIYREVSPKLVANPAAVDAGPLADAAKLFQAFGERYHEQ